MYSGWLDVANVENNLLSDRPYDLDLGTAGISSNNVYPGHGSNTYTLPSIVLANGFVQPTLPTGLSSWPIGHEFTMNLEVSDANSILAIGCFNPTYYKVYEDPLSISRGVGGVERIKFRWDGSIWQQVNALSPKKNQSDYTYSGTALTLSTRTLNFITLEANYTLPTTGLSEAISGDIVNFVFKQDSTAGRTVTFSSFFHATTGNDNGSTATRGQMAAVSFICVESNATLEYIQISPAIQWYSP